MTEYLDTEEAQQRSLIYSNAHMSDRQGFGPHIHLSWPKSCQEIQQELGEKLGRPVSIGEFFITTHTKPDGSYVDRKAEKIAQNYEKNVQGKLVELGADSSTVSDYASRPRELTTDDYMAIFLQSTEKDSRGTPYGVGSLKEILVNGKRKQPEDSSSFVALQEQLKEAERKIEEHAAYNERRNAEVAACEAKHFRAVVEKKNKLEHLLWKSISDKLIRNFSTSWHHIHLQQPQSLSQPVFS